MATFDGILLWTFIAISAFNFGLSIYGLYRIWGRAKINGLYILLIITFLLNLLMPLGLIVISLYQIPMFVNTLFGSLVFFVTFARRRPQVGMRMSEVYLGTWILWLISSGFVASVIVGILGFSLGVYGVIIGFYSMGSLKNEFTSDAQRKKTYPPYLACYKTGVHDVTVSASLVDDKDITKAVGLGTTAHIFLIANFALIGAAICFAASSYWWSMFYFFQICTIPAWTIIIHVCLSIYDLSGKSPKVYGLS